jgi:signal transduction histidine kinase
VIDRIVSGALLLVLSCCGLMACSQHSEGDVRQGIQITTARLHAVKGMQLTGPPAHIEANAFDRVAWKQVVLPDIAKREIIAQPLGEVRTQTDWYRLDSSALQGALAPRYLYLPRWKTIGRLAIYGDGNLLYSSEGSIVHNGFNHPLLIRLNPAEGQKAPASIVLRIDRLQSSGSAVSTVWVGPLPALVWRYQVRQILQTQLPYVGGAALLAVGLFALALWIRLRHDTMYLLFFGTSFVAFVRMLHYHVGANYLPISDEWFEWVTVVSLIWLIVLCHRFMERLHERRLKWLTPSLLAAATLSSVILAPGALQWIPQLTLITPMLYAMLLPLAIAVFFDAVRNAFRSKLREVWLMAIWLFLTTSCCAYDLALQSNQVSPEGVYTNPYAIIGLFVMFSHIMYRRYLSAVDAVEQANASLAHKLKKRETELNASYDRLRKVERQQTLTDERLRITQDMHDGLGSALVSALRVVETGNVNHSVVSEILKNCIADLKLMIDSMEPVETDLLLLLATLRFRIDPQLSMAGIRLRWEVQDVPLLAWLDQRSSLQILRIIQEAFTNVLKHTKATEIAVRTAVSDAGVNIMIEDNGQGFDVAARLAKPTGHGLSNQRRRAMAFGGHVHWASDLQGTRFTLWLPMQARPDSLPTV